MRCSAALLAVVLAPGCSTVCKGAGCEDSYPFARLSVLGAGAPDAVDVWADADAMYSGECAPPDETEGSGWTVAGLAAGGNEPTRLVIGQPDANQVLLIDATSFDCRSSWAGQLAGAEFGRSIAAVPAASGDGGFDLWVGAPGTDYGKGVVELFRRADADRAFDVIEWELRFVSDTPNDHFGERIYQCGDLTGDGLPEIAITAPYLSTPAEWPYDDIPALAGAVFVMASEQVAARATGPVTVSDIVDAGLGRAYWGIEIGQGAGTAIVCDKDLDGNGTIEFVIGSPYYLDGRGRLDWFSVDAAGAGLPLSGPLCASTDDGICLDGDPLSTSIPGPFGEEEQFGASLVALNVGPRKLLAIASPGYAGGLGRVHVVRGSQFTTDASPPDIADLRGPVGRELFTDHVGKWLGIGDLDGDQLDDLIVGAPDFKGEATNAYDTGELWVWYGARLDAWGIGTTTDDADVAVTGTEPFQRIGRAAIAFDIDGQAPAELVVPTRAAKREP